MQSWTHCIGIGRTGTRCSFVRRDSGLVASSASLGSSRDPATGAHPDVNEVVEVQVPKQ